MSWFFGGPQRTDESFENYRTLFFAGFIHPELQQRAAAARRRKRDSSDAHSQRGSVSGDEEEDDALTQLVRDLFAPYGEMELFFFDAGSGCGAVRYQSGKSGENCFLMSHLLPFRVERDERDGRKPQSARRTAAAAAAVAS